MINPIDESIIENNPLPITDIALKQVPVIAQLCHLFQTIIDMNELNMSQYSKMSTSSKLTISKSDFVNLLSFINAKCLDEEAQVFFDYLLDQKLQLYKTLYPHFSLVVQRGNETTMSLLQNTSLISDKQKK